MLNNVVIQGRLTREPEAKVTSTGKSVCSFGIACQANREKVDFFDVTTFGGTADFVQKYFTKGQEIIVNGYLNQSRWTDNQGTHRSKLEVVALGVNFCGSKGDNTEVPKAENPANIYVDGAEQSPSSWTGNVPETDDDELPF